MGCQKCAEKKRRAERARLALARAKQAEARAAAAKQLELATAWHRWGWKFIHRFTLALPPGALNATQLNHMRRIIQLFIETLPCKECVGHATEFLAGGPAPRLGRVQTGHTMAELLYQLHNNVNVRTNKPEKPFEVLEEYKPVNLRIAFREYSAAIRQEPNPPTLALDTIDTHLKGLNL